MAIANLSSWETRIQAWCYELQKESKHRDFEKFPVSFQLEPAMLRQTDSGVPFYRQLINSIITELKKYGDFDVNEEWNLNGYQDKRLSESKKITDSDYESIFAGYSSLRIRLEFCPKPEPKPAPELEAILKSLKKQEKMIAELFSQLSKGEKPL